MNNRYIQRLLHHHIYDADSSPLLIEIELLLLTFATGIQDAAAYPDYQCFASNQTGNTIFLAVAVARIGDGLFDVKNIGVSLGCFLAGSYVMGQLGNLIGPRRRVWLLLTNFIQVIMVFVAAGVQWKAGVHHSGPITLAILFLLSFSSGAQVAMTRPLKITQITTAMATAAFVDLLVDPHVHKLHNRARNRRLLFLLCLALGAMVGAFIYSYRGSAATLLACAISKTVVMILFYFNDGEMEKKLAVVN